MLSISFSGFLVQERLVVLGLKAGGPRFGCQLHKLDGHAFIPGRDTLCGQFERLVELWQ